MKHNITVIYLISLFFIALSGLEQIEQIIPPLEIVFSIAIGLVVISAIWLIFNKGYTIRHLAYFFICFGLFFMCHSLRLLTGTYTNIEIFLLCGAFVAGIMLYIKGNRYEKKAKKEEVKIKSQQIANEINELNNIRPVFIKRIVISFYFVLCCLDSFKAVKLYGFKRFFSGNEATKLRIK